MTDPAAAKVLEKLVWPLRLTHAGLWAERISRAFWPVWTIALLTFAALAFGLQDLGPILWVQIAAFTVGTAALIATFWGWRAFRKPLRAEAMARLDATLPGRPLAALEDTQVIGANDPASLAVWRAHLQRMAARAATAKPVAPDLRLSSRDPYSLRYVALTAAVMAALFGSLWRVSSVAGIAPGPAEAAIAGPSWEGWAQPPAYTGKPSIYLTDITATTLEVPVGTRIQIRLYGPEGALTVKQTIAQVAPQPVVAPDEAAPKPAGVAGMSDLTVSQSGTLEIAGAGGRLWQIIATPDRVPLVEVVGEMTREADGTFKQSFKASDDYGVIAGRVTIALDLPKVDRRHGLTVQPEAIAPVVLDLPMPIKGSRTEFSELLADDLSQNALANLPVTMVFAVTDAAGQWSEAAPYEVVLHGRRFFDPVAAAVIEMRRDLLWNRVNAPRTVQILKAVSNRPEDLIRSKRAALHLRVALRELDAMQGTMTVEQRDAMAEKLWDIALMFEIGDLSSAMDRLQRAQDRLEEAIKNGASPEEIDQLMKELQQAMKEYTQELAEEAQRNPDGMPKGGEGQEITGDQMQQMLDEIERLMKEGKTAEAMALMEQLRQLMENMQITQGEGKGDGSGPMGDLGDTLGDQQDLSDDAYRDLQKDRNGEGPGQDPDELAQRQRDLRERLQELQDQKLPGDGTETGEAGRDALDRAEEAMKQAERALEEGDLDGALGHQADAMEEMRDGMRAFGDALAEENREKDGAGRTEQAGRLDPNGTDPLGRKDGDSARIGSDQNMVQNNPDLRAQELLDEIRRRSGEAQRPTEELDYLKRLLDLF